MANIKKTIEIQFQINNSPLETFSGSIEEVIDKVETLEQAIGQLPDAELKLKVDGVDKTSQEIKTLGQQAIVTEKQISSLGVENGDLSKTFADVYGEVQPLTGKLGELEDRLYQLALAGQQNSVEFQTLTAEAGRYRQAQIKTDLAVDSASKTLGQKMGGALQGVAGAFAIAQGAAGLFGSENENVEKAILRTTQALALIQGLDAFEKAIPDLKAFGKQLGLLTIFQKANAAATKVTAGVMKLFGQSVDTSSKAFKGLKGAIAATGIGLLVVAIGELVANWDKISAAISGTTEKQKAYNNIVKETLANSTAEVASLEVLYETSQDVTLSIEKRRAAAVKLQETYPATFANFTQEEILLGKGKTAYDNLAKSIVNAALAKAKQSQIDEKANEINEKDIEILERIEKLKKEKEKAGVTRGTSSYTDPYGGTITSTTESKADIQKIIDKLQGDRKKLRTNLLAYVKEIGAIAEEDVDENKNNAINLLKGQIENQKRKVDNLKAAGKETYAATLLLYQQERKLLQKQGLSTIDVQNKINELQRQNTEKAAASRTTLLKGLDDKAKKAYDDKLKSLQATYDNEKALADKNLQESLNNAKGLEQQVALKQEYTDKIKSLDDKLVEDRYSSLAGLQKGNKLNETQEKEKSTELLNIQTQYNDDVDGLNDDLAEIEKARLNAKIDREKTFSDLNNQSAEGSLSNLEDNLKNQLDAIDKSTTKGLDKAKDLQKQIIELQKQSALSAEATASQNIIDDLTKQKEAELALYEENESKKVEISKLYDDQIKKQKETSADNIVSINENATKAIEANESESAVDRKKIEEDLQKEKLDVIAKGIDSAMELANALGDLAKAMMDLETKQLENEYKKRAEANEAKNEALLDNDELTEEQKAELTRRANEESAALEEEKQAKLKEIKKKEANLDFAITVANIIANTAKAIMSVAPAAPLMILAGAIGAIQVGIANKQKQTVLSLAKGGMVYGPGNGTSDSIPAMLSNGESVINAEATSRYANILSAINQSTGGAPIMPKFMAAGGVVTPSQSGISAADLAAVTGIGAVRAYVLESEISSKTVRNNRIARDARLS